jgi:hypothetical protein
MSIIYKYFLQYRLILKRNLNYKALDAFCAKKFYDIIENIDKNVIEQNLGLALKGNISIFGNGFYDAKMRALSFLQPFVFWCLRNWLFK